MTMISDNWAALLAPGLRKVFHTRMRARDELFKRTQIFPVETSQRAYEDFQGIGEMGTNSWSEFEKTGRVGYDSFDKGFLTRLEHREFAGGVTIQRKLVADNLYPGAGIPRTVTGRVEKLADSASLHRELSAAAVFINAFTDSGVDNDGYNIAGTDSVGLCSTAHPNGPADSSTQSNEGTLALSKDNVIATNLLMREFADDKGQIIASHPDTLLVPPELEQVAIETVGTPLDPTSANNTINTVAGRYQVVVWDYLTDSNAWFMIDSGLKSQHLIWLDREAPEFQAEENFDTLQGKYRGYYRYSRGWDDWRWIYGQNPS